MPTAQEVHEMLMRQPSYRARHEAREARKAEVGDRYANLGPEDEVGYTSGGDYYNYIRDDGSVGRKWVAAADRKQFEKDQSRLRQALEKGRDINDIRGQMYRSNMQPQQQPFQQPQQQLQQQAGAMDPQRMDMLAQLMGSMGSNMSANMGGTGGIGSLTPPQQNVSRMGMPSSPYGAQQSQPDMGNSSSQNFWQLLKKYGGT